MAEVRLGQYLSELARNTRFDWVSANCFTMCADWVLASTGKDPAEKWRGAWTNKDDGLKLLRREGGATAFASKAMTRAGFSLTENPQAGDVALVWSPIGKVGRKMINRPTGAICVDEKQFALLTVDLGLFISPMRLIKAWKIGRG